jgi:hypothetical protein
MDLPFLLDSQLLAQLIHKLNVSAVYLLKIETPKTTYTVNLSLI